MFYFLKMLSDYKNEIDKQSLMAAADEK
jgi:hypothetical protein